MVLPGPIRTIALSRPLQGSSPVRYPICLRASYAMSGTDMAYGASCLCASFAMSGTGRAKCYAIAGTDIANDSPA
eukprot:2867045-Rhodomonas_salina.2